MGQPRHGDHMRPLDIDALGLTSEHRHDPLVLRFIELDDRTSRAEMISDPDDWTPEQKAAYKAEDYALFSRLRGYSAEEIADHADFVRMAHEIDEKYGPDTAAGISYLLWHQTTEE
jgi:hypothetical protein